MLVYLKLTSKLVDSFPKFPVRLFSFFIQHLLLLSKYFELVKYGKLGLILMFLGAHGAVGIWLLP
jgi:hypothetical protein